MFCESAELQKKLFCLLLIFWQKNHLCSSTIPSIVHV
jgi:hypothetical protein